MFDTNFSAVLQNLAHGWGTHYMDISIGEQVSQFAPCKDKNSCAVQVRCVGKYRFWNYANWFVAEGDVMSPTHFHQ